MLCVLGWHCLAASLCVIPALLCVILCYKHPPHYVLYQLYCVTSVVCPPRLEEQLPGSQVSAPDPLQTPKSANYATGIPGKYSPAWKRHPKESLGFGAASQNMSLTQSVSGRLQRNS